MMTRNPTQLLPLLWLGCAAPSLDDTSKPESEAPRWTQVAAGDVQTCALNGESRIECWGGESLDGRSDTGGWTDYDDDEPPDGTFESISLSSGTADYGSWHGCAIREEGGVTCWGRDDRGQASPPPGEYESLALSAYFSCGLTLDGHIDCWGDPDVESYTPDEGGHTDLAAGNLSACAIDAAGAASCWNSAELEVDREGMFTDIAVGGLVCASSSEEPIVCWVRNSGPEINPVDIPTDAGFIDLCVGWGHNGCALSSEGEVNCWGNHLSEAPDGTFVQISCGTYHSCAVTDDGDIVCWGNCVHGECDVPS